MKFSTFSTVPLQYLILAFINRQRYYFTIMTDSHVDDIHGSVNFYARRNSTSIHRLPLYIHVLETGDATFYRGPLTVPGLY